jgi:hypothetical protein
MKVEELTGAQLNYWVAKAQGVSVKNWAKDGAFYQPSALWITGGPIIERENIQISPPTSPVHRCGGPNAGNGQSGVWSACTWNRGVDGRRAIAHDENSALIAAMRCYVRLKFGEIVSDEVPA